jgi:hypothetical protein
MGSFGNLSQWGSGIGNWVVEGGGLGISGFEISEFEISGFEI